jgi:hypothetical protein
MDIMETVAKDIVSTIEAIAKSSHASDEKLFELSKTIIQAVTALNTVVKNQGHQILKLQERHDALLQAFYSHCEQVAQEEIH